MDPALSSCFTHTTGSTGFPHQMKGRATSSQVLAKGKFTFFFFFCNQISCGSPKIAGTLLPVPHCKQQLSNGARCLNGLIIVRTPSRQSIGQADGLGLLVLGMAMLKLEVPSGLLLPIIISNSLLSHPRDFSLICGFLSFQ